MCASHLATELGHSTPAMHSHYSHVDQNEKAEAVGKVIELVTMPPKPQSEDRKRGLKRGPDEPLKMDASATGSNFGGATQI